MNPCDAYEEEPSRTKKQKLSFTSRSGLTLLPDEMVLSCLARVSRTDHASLSLVSKWHRSVVASPELYDFRSLLGFTEAPIYLCLSIPTDPNPRWFTLSPNPLNRQLVPVQSYFYQPPEASAILAHGYGIYIMGGRIGGRATSSVLFLDCRTHTWSTLPSMLVARHSALAGVVDGNIYVLGGCVSREASKWGEVFDTKEQTWHALPMPLPQCNFPLVNESIVIKEEKKVVVLIDTGICLSYIPSESKWKQQGYRELSGSKRCWHVIENVLYCSEIGGRILWCEPSELDWEVMEWRDVLGLEALRETLAASKLVSYRGWMSDKWELFRRSLEMLWFFGVGVRTMEIDELLPGHKLTNSGPNMLIFWEVLSPHKLEIWCAEISLERRNKTCEIIGNILWSQAVMTLDPPPHQHHYKILSALPLNL